MSKARLRSFCETKRRATQPDKQRTQNPAMSKSKHKLNHLPNSFADELITAERHGPIAFNISESEQSELDALKAEETLAVFNDGTRRAVSKALSCLELIEVALNEVIR